MANTLEERHVLIRITGDREVVEAYTGISRAGDRSMRKVETSTHRAARAMEALGTGDREVVEAYTGISRAGDRSMRKVETSTHRAARAMEALGAAGKRALGSLTRDVAAFATAAAKAFAMASTAAAGFFAVASAKAAVARDSQIRSLTSLMGTADAARKHFRDLQRDALLPGVTLDGALELSVRLQSVGMEAQFARKAIVEVGNAIALSGGTDEALSRASLALQQIIASPALQGDELRQLADAVPQVRKVLVDAFGTASTEQIAKFGLTTQEMVAIIVEGLSKLERADPTAKANQLVNVTAAIKELFVAFGEGLTGNEAMASLNGFATVVQALIPMARTAGIAIGHMLDPAIIASGLEGIVAAAAAVGNFGSHVADVARISAAAFIGVGKAMFAIGQDALAVVGAVVKAWSTLAFSLPRMVGAAIGLVGKAFGLAVQTATAAAGMIGRLFGQAAGVVGNAWEVMTRAVRDAIGSLLRPIMQWWEPARRAWEEIQAAGRDITTQWDAAKRTVADAGQQMQAALDENSRQWGAWQAKQDAVIECWFAQATAMDNATAAANRNTAAVAGNAAAQQALARAAAENAAFRTSAVGAASLAGQAAVDHARRLERQAAATMDPQIARQFREAQRLAAMDTAQEDLPGEGLSAAARQGRYLSNLRRRFGAMEVSTKGSDARILRAVAEIESLTRAKDAATPAQKEILDAEIQARRDNVDAMKAAQQANVDRYNAERARLDRLMDGWERIIDLAEKRERAAQLRAAEVAVGGAAASAAAESAKRITMAVHGSQAAGRRESMTDSLAAAVLGGGGATDVATITAEAKLRSGYDTVKATVYDSVTGLFRIVSDAIKDGTRAAVEQSRLTTQSMIRGAT